MRAAFFGLCAAVAVVGAYATHIYNHEVALDEGVRQGTSNIQVEISRAAALLPNEATITSSAAGFEGRTLQNVAAARSAAQGVSRIDPSRIVNDPGLQRQVIEAQEKIGAALVQVRSAVESNPQLRSMDQFATLASQVEGSQNRITWARLNLQEAFRDYNRYVRVFPHNIVAGAVGFVPRDYGDTGSQADVPVLRPMVP